MSVLVASLVAIPLAYFTTRFNFGGAALIQTLGIVPLIMPPFVGAVAMQLLFGANGSRQPAAATSGSGFTFRSWRV